MRQAVSTPSAPAAIGPYSQAVRAGSLLFVSGQIPLDPQTGAMVDGDIAGQTHRVFQNIKAILAEAGMTLADVIRFSAFVTDRAYFPIYGRVRERYVAGDAFASTLIVVSGFTRPGTIHFGVAAPLLPMGIEARPCSTGIDMPIPGS